jgi:hypothetical protein
MYHSLSTQLHSLPESIYPRVPSFPYCATWAETDASDFVTASVHTLLSQIHNFERSSSTSCIFLKESEPNGMQLHGLRQRTCAGNRSELRDVES